MDPAGAPRRRPRVMAWIGLALVVVGITAAVAGGANGFPALTKFLNSGTVPVATPLSTQQSFVRGTYEVYQGVGELSALQPGDVNVTGPDGPLVTGRPTGAKQQIVRDGLSYHAEVQFVVPRAGVYTVSITAVGDTVVIDRSLTDLITGQLGWFALFGFGVLGAIAGVVLFIVGLVRKPRYQPVGVTFATPPAGWYPDPGGSAQRRYWDGRAWTEHTG